MKTYISHTLRGLVIVALLAGLGGTLRPPQVQAASPQDTQAAGDWPMYQHDPSHSGRTTSTMDNSGPLYTQWAYSFGERVEVEVQPVIAGGTAYVGVMNGDMVAINLETGSARWTKRPGGPIPHTAAVNGGKVYFGSLDGKVYALNTSDGSTAWSFTTEGPVSSAPAVVDERVFIGSTDGKLYALNANSGAELWSLETGGPVVSSPAVANGRVYFGSEDMFARAVNASNGNLIWETQLYGAGMHNTHPVISDDGDVVIFVTSKPGLTSYVPSEGYPEASSGANPVSTWNSFYQEHPDYRTLYYLDTSDGDDLWDPGSRRYVPMPIPYWTLIEPVLNPDGSAWFPAPAGTAEHDFVLNHDNHLFRVNLSNGETSEWDYGCQDGDHSCREGGFQLRDDEVGRHIFSGDDYYYSISEDIGVYRPDDKSKRALYTNGDPSGYNFGSHMDPHSPMPSLHLWRYGGAITMGGVPGASPPIVSEGKLYFISYGWLYAVGPQDQDKNAATDFTTRDTRLYELTYPRSTTPSVSEIRTEVDQRVADIINRGSDDLPLTARWEQADASGQGLLNNEFNFEVYGFETDIVRTLSEAYPYVSSDLKNQLKVYLAEVVDRYLLDDFYYTSQSVECIIYGKEGRYQDSDCRIGDQIEAKWQVKNPNLVAMRLYAIWAYANATGDWDRIESHWDNLIWKYFNANFLNDNFCKPHATMNFCVFEEWRVGRLNIGAQIGAAQAVRDMAAHLGKNSARNSADQFLDSLLKGRVKMADFVPSLYRSGQLEPWTIRLNNEVYSPGHKMYDARIYHDDIFGHESPYNGELVPYDAKVRDEDTDPSQLNWWYGNSDFGVDGGIGFMHYQALSGYFPLSDSLINTIRNNLMEKTRYYLKSYEVNNPWWWMADLAHSSTCSGEHLYHSPTLSWTIFQVKAWVLQEDWDTLANQLPLATSFNSKYDLYRLQNLVTLLALPDIPNVPDLGGSTIAVSDNNPKEGERITFQAAIENRGAPSSEVAYMTNTLPDGLEYVADSLSATCGTADDEDAPTLRWSGTLGSNACVIEYDVTITEVDTKTISNEVSIHLGNTSTDLIIAITTNGLIYYFPIMAK